MSIEARAAFLRRIHLFHDLKDEDLAVIAGMLTEETFVPEEHVFLQGEEANRFFIIYQGTVDITQVLGKEVRDLAQLVDGDYFGEEALLGRRKHSGHCRRDAKEIECFPLRQNNSIRAQEIPEAEGRVGSGGSTAGSWRARCTSSGCGRAK